MARRQTMQRQFGGLNRGLADAGNTAVGVYSAFNPAVRAGLAADDAKRGDWWAVLGSVGPSLLGRTSKLFKGVQNWIKGKRLGKLQTRLQVRQIANELVSRGWTITNGGERLPRQLPERLLKGPLGKACPDITATKNGRVLHINTADVDRAGNYTARELRAAKRIRAAMNPREHLLLIPKMR
jgi:hypothetical protein